MLRHHAAFVRNGSKTLTGLLRGEAAPFRDLSLLPACPHVYTAVHFELPDRSQVFCLGTRARPASGSWPRQPDQARRVEAPPLRQFLEPRPGSNGGPAPSPRKTTPSMQAAPVPSPRPRLPRPHSVQKNAISRCCAACSQTLSRLFFPTIKRKTANKKPRSACPVSSSRSG